MLCLTRSRISARWVPSLPRRPFAAGTRRPRTRPNRAEREDRHCAGCRSPFAVLSFGQPVRQRSKITQYPLMARDRVYRSTQCPLSTLVSSSLRKRHPEGRSSHCARVDGRGCCGAPVPRGPEQALRLFCRPNNARYGDQGVGSPLTRSAFEPPIDDISPTLNFPHAILLRTPPGCPTPSLPLYRARRF
jgi:hypothetical protein